MLDCWTKDSCDVAGAAVSLPGRPVAPRVKRQNQQQGGDETTTKKEESFEAELCKDKDAGEWFRLVAGEGDNCRDVIQCTSSVSTYRNYCTEVTEVKVEVLTWTTTVS